MPPFRRPELLAPAGDRDCIRAAIENGADAVYFGLDCGLNARARATNFAPDDVPEIMATLHQRGLKGYVTLNVLVFPNELPEAESLIRLLARSGVDAVLVQDIGLARLIRAICPDLPMHASTQMTMTSAECIAVAQELGIGRVVVARELSLDEIRSIRLKSDIEIEAFVHGALCVAYSGQCLTSESLGGRSANRGQCAQACRLPYELVCDGQDVDLGEMKYLLSPQDLAAFMLVPDLVDAGVCSLKIEGRLKQAEYVANITRHYRDAIETAAAGRPVEFSDDAVREMELSFSRGFSPGWLGGCDHKMLVPALSSTKRGVFLGEVTAIRGQRVEVRLASPIAAGDGVVFEGDRANDREQGGRVFHVRRRGEIVKTPVSSGTVELEFGRDAIDLSQIEPRLQIWKTDDPQLTRRLRQSFDSPHPLRKLALDVVVEARCGEPLRLSATAANGARCELRSLEPLAAAQKHPLTEDVLREQFGRLGRSVYELRSLTATIDESPVAPMVPLSVLGQLRRELVEQLDANARAIPERRIADDSALAALRSTIPASAAVSAAARLEPELRVLCRSLDQLEAVIAAESRSVFVDFADIREYRRAVEIAHQHGVEILLATPRIQKPEEAGIFRALLKHGADGILVRNLAGLRFFSDESVPVVADFSLNAANELTTQFLIEQGAARVTASYDLNREQLLDLVQATPPGWLEIVIHQHMPMFHMEHCVFCAVLSPGTNKTNCGRPCDVHTVRLRDRVGMEHLLTADVGCRNTLFNATPQSGAEAVASLLSAGIRHFRVELLDTPPTGIASMLALYRSLLNGNISASDVWRQLKASNRVGVTRGTLEERRDPLALL